MWLEFGYYMPGPMMLDQSPDTLVSQNNLVAQNVPVFFSYLGTLSPTYRRGK